jgi:glycine betaine/proline transport system ATP-binding protein
VDPELLTPSPRQDSVDGSAQIACRGVWKLYGPDPGGFLGRHGGSPSLEDCRAAGYVAAVRDVGFAVAPGEILVVMGLSGSGKSTLVRCLSRLVEPTAGEVRFAGLDLLKVDRRGLIELRRHKMGMVFQHFGLLPHRTVLDNVAFPLEVQGIGRSRREERAREVIRLVGLEGRERHYPRQLSGGQQQRVGIARSLAVEPDVWFLDEPFSALDPLIRREMQDEFLRLQRALRKTIVFITHDFAEAVRVADRIGIMKDGALVQLGTPEELVLDPADGYVAAFVKDAPRGKLVSVARMMQPLTGAVAADGTVPADAKLEEAAPQVLAAAGPVVVVDVTGAPVGLLTRERLLELLFPPARAA